MLKSVKHEKVFYNLWAWSMYSHLSYDIASGSEITSCNKIAKPLVVYTFTGNVMMS